MSFSEWKTYTLGEVCQSISNTHKQKKGKLIFLNTGDIERGEILHDNYSEISSMPGQAKKAIQKDDILFSEIRPANGRWAYVNTDGSNYIVSTKLMVIRAGEKIYPKYLYHFLTNRETTKWLQHLAESRSGTFPQITFDQVADIEISIPSICEQQEIASFIDALDDKIDLNQQNNQTIYEIAQTLFKQWFVNFNFPGATEEMIDSELGEVPKGWKVEKLGRVLDVKGGTTPSTKEDKYWNGEFHWVTPKDLSYLKSPVLLDTERKISKEGVEQISSKILPEGTLLLSCRAPIGYLAMSQIPISINQGFIAINGLTVSNLFMLFWLKENMTTVISKANGSTFLEISKTAFKNIDIIVPDKTQLNLFDKIVTPLFETIANNEYESKTLNQLRNRLVPKLLAGEILV